MNILAIFLISVLGFAQINQPGAKCIKLEGINLPGCVPSTTAICHSGQWGNCSVRGDSSNCTYVKAPLGVYWRDVNHIGGNMALDCPGGRDSICPPAGETGACTPGPCKRYAPPVCRSVCDACVENEWVERVPYEGCDRMCDAHYCSDERNCNPTSKCGPTDYLCNIANCLSKPKTPGYEDYVLPSQQYPTCKSNPPCPDTVYAPSDATPANCPGCVFTTDSYGRVSIQVTVSKDGECPKDLTIKPANTMPNSIICPWIGATTAPRPANEGSWGYRFSKDNNSCGPVEAGNRYPVDCCECDGNNQNIDGKNAKCRVCDNIKSMAQQDKEKECARRPPGGYAFPP